MIEIKNRCSKKQNYLHHIKINDPKRFSNLGKIDYAVFDKTGTLTSPQFSVELIYDGQKCVLKDSPVKPPMLDLVNVDVVNSISINLSPININKQDPKQYKSISEMELSQAISGSVRFGENNIETSSTNVKKDFFFYNIDEEKTVEILKAASLMILCQKNKRNKPEILSLEEQAISELCKNNKHEYEQLSSRNEYQVKNEKVVLLGVNDYSSRKRISALFYDKNENTYILFCKGNKNSILEVLAPMDAKEIEIINSEIAKFESKNLKMIFYVKKQINSNAAKMWQEKLQGIKSLLVTSEKALEDAAHDFENNFELIGIMGLKERIKPGAKETFHFFSEVIKSKVWILTGDNFTNAYNVSKELYYNKRISRDCIHFKDKTANGLKQFIRNILDDVKNYTDDFQTFEKFENENHRTVVQTTLQKFKKGLLFVDGKILHMIMADPYLNLHFIFIVSLFQNLIGYNMTPELKEYMIDITKKINYEKQIILAVGDSFNDARMMKAADVSIEVVNNGVGKGIGDIQVNDLNKIQEIVLIKGHNTLKSLFLILRIRYIQSFILILSVVWLHYIYGLTYLYKIFTEYQKVFFFGALPFFDSVLFCLINEINIQKIIEKLNDYLEEEKEKKALIECYRRSYLNLIKKEVRKGFFKFKDALDLFSVIVCINYACFRIGMEFISQEGNTNDVLTISLFIFLNLVFFGQQKIFSNMIHLLLFLKEKMVGVLILVYLLILILTVYFFGKTSDHFYELYMFKNNMPIFVSIFWFTIIYKKIVKEFYDKSMKIIFKFLKNKKQSSGAQLGNEEK